MVFGFCGITANGKSICEGGAKNAKFFLLKTAVSKNFFRLPNLQIIWETEKFFAAENADTFYYDFNPAFANTMLAEVVFI